MRPIVADLLSGQFRGSGMGKEKLPKVLPSGRGSVGGATPQVTLSVCPLAASCQLRGRGLGLLGNLGTGGRKPREEKEAEGEEAEAPHAAPAPQPGPSHPVTRQILAPAAGLGLPPQPSPGPGREAAARSCRAPAPRTAGTPVVRTLTHHLQTALRTASRSRYRQSAPQLTSVSGAAPPHPPEVRPSGRGRKKGAGLREGAAWGRGSHACSPEGPGAKGAVRVWAGRRAGRDETCRRGGRARTSALVINNITTRAAEEGQCAWWMHRSV